MPDRSWTLLDSRQIAQYPILRLREDRYRFEPSGAESRFIVCDTADWALIIATTLEGELILIRQYRHGVRQVVLEVPGGVLDAGESPEEAAGRELREETGYEAGRIRYVGKMLPNPAINSARLHVVRAEDCRRVGPPQFDSFEQIEVVLRPLDAVPRMISSGEIDHALVIASFALLKAVPQ
ncbi:MAG: NUDIX hydrolase [Rhodopirellula sp.]|nr:NUDIX hydrolase [Rhodopirellula sp.]